jgi:ring-1,2-phenylacetyl-CoA epoxidase subunit PaaC
LYQQLKSSTDNQLSAIAEKSLKEVNYHLRWSSEWVIRLGDGSEESRQRMLAATDDLWTYTGELFYPTEYEQRLPGEVIPVDIKSLKLKWEEKIRTVFDEATLPYPVNAFMQTGGKEGRHTEHLGYILAEMQYMQRTYPNSEW